MGASVLHSRLKASLRDQNVPLPQSEDDGVVTGDDFSVTQHVQRLASRRHKQILRAASVALPRTD